MQNLIFVSVSDNHYKQCNLILQGDNVSYENPNYCKWCFKFLNRLI